MINALTMVPSRGVAVWSILAGITLMLTGGLVMTLESRELPIPRWVGWTVLGMGIVGGALAPMSGFWLLLVPAVGLLRQRVAVGD